MGFNSPPGTTYTRSVVYVLESRGEEKTNVMRNAARLLLQNMKRLR
jgi:hypothetical protein